MDKSEKQSLLYETFNQGFPKYELEKWIKPVKKFINEHKEFLLEQGADASIVKSVAKYPSKDKLIGMACIPFETKAVFEAFRAFLPKDVCTVMDALVWEDELGQAEIKERFGIEVDVEITRKGYGAHIYRVRELNPDFDLLNMGYYRSWTNYGGYTLKLLLPLRKILIDYYKAPEGKDLKPLAEIEKTDYLYVNGERDIFLELPRLMAYYSQGQIKTTNKGKPQQSTLGKMQRKLSLQEFYPEAKQKELKLLRTNLLAGLIVTPTHSKVENGLPVFIKTLFQHSYIEHYLSLHCIISYLRGTGYIDPGDTVNIELTFFDILSTLPPGEWISIENLETHIKYNLLPVEVIDSGYSAEKLYYVYEPDLEKEKYYYSNKHHVDKARFYDSLVLPMVKGTFYLFAAFGLLDIAYDEVDASVMGKTCESPYDGLRYVRLNNLGAYFNGQMPDYKMPDAIGESSIVLSNDSLTIIADKQDATAPVLLEPYSERVSPNRYRTDHTFFLKNCKSKKELKDKIKLFKESVTDKLPLNWIAFFEELEGKINPLESVTNIKTYKIPPENKVLIQLIARDPTLRKLCLKAEDYHILVEKTKLSRFKKRLQEFGYLLT